MMNLQNILDGVIRKSQQSIFDPRMIVGTYKDNAYLNKGEFCLICGEYVFEDYCGCFCSNYYQIYGSNGFSPYGKKICLKTNCDKYDRMELCRRNNVVDKLRGKIRIYSLYNDRIIP